MSNKNEKYNLLGVHRNIWATSLTSFVNDISTEMILTLLPIYLHHNLKSPVIAIGVIEGVALAVTAFLKIISGYISDKIYYRKYITASGYALSALARPFLVLASGWKMAACIRWVDRVGKGFRGAPRDALIADSVPRSQRGLSYGLHRAGEIFGAVVSLLLAIYIVNNQQSDNTNLDDNTYKTIIYLSIPFGLLSAICMLVFAVDVKPKTNDEEFITPSKEDMQNPIHETSPLLSNISYDSYTTTSMDHLSNPITPQRLSTDEPLVTPGARTQKLSTKVVILDDGDEDGDDVEDDYEIEEEKPSQSVHRSMSSHIVKYSSQPHHDLERIQEGESAKTYPKAAVTLSRVNSELKYDNEVLDHEPLNKKSFEFIHDMDSIYSSLHQPSTTIDTQLKYHYDPTIHRDDSEHIILNQKSSVFSTFSRLGTVYFTLLGIFFIFQLGNPSDAFMVLLAKDSGYDINSILYLMLLYNLTCSIVSIPMGWVSDKLQNTHEHGRGYVIVTGWLLRSVVFTMLTQATSLLQFSILFCLYGFYSGCVEAVLKALIADIIGARKSSNTTVRGLSFGLFQGLIGVADILSGIITGLLWDLYGARVTYYYAASVGLVCSALLLIWRSLIVEAKPHVSVDPLHIHHAHNCRHYHAETENQIHRDCKTKKSPDQPETCEVVRTVRLRRKGWKWIWHNKWSEKRSCYINLYRNATPEQFDLLQSMSLISGRGKSRKHRREQLNKIQRENSFRSEVSSIYSFSESPRPNTPSYPI